MFCFKEYIQKKITCTQNEHKILPEYDNKNNLVKKVTIILSEKSSQYLRLRCSHTNQNYQVQYQNYHKLVLIEPASTSYTSINIGGGGIVIIMISYYS